VVADDSRWREAVVDVFMHAAEAFRAFFAAAQVETGWTVTRNNRLFGTAASLQEGEHILRGRLWQGLPPVPLWLTWYGDGYRDLVRDALRRTEVVERDKGILVRLSEQPLPRTELPGLELPEELTYEERRAIEYPDGSRGTNLAQPEDRAAEIPDLECDT
jgi:hypothetical protein